MSLPQRAQSDAPHHDTGIVSTVSEARPSVARSLLISVLIAALAALALYVIFNTEPKSERGGAVKNSAMPVEVVAPEFGRFRPRIVSTGTVQAAQDIRLSSEVSGRVTKVSPDFVPGGFVKEGQPLVSIQKADYLNALAQRKSELQNALAEFELERGRREVALAEYKRLGEEKVDMSDPLALRQPQLKAAHQRVEAARMSVKNAELDVRRTEVRAPFDALVLERDANIGSQVGSGTPLARLVGIDHYWVIVSVPLATLRWLDIPKGGRRGTKARVRNASAWSDQEYREGHIERLIGAVEADSRMARVVVTIDDPLARELSGDPPKLIVGEYLEVELVGEELPEMARLPREYIRAGDTVWVMKDGRLNIREVKVATRDVEYGYVREGLEPGEKVVSSNLATVREGVQLRLQAESAAPSQPAEGATP